MSNKLGPTVSTVTKVKDGRHTYQYDLSDGKLVIEYRHGKKEPIRITLGSFPLNALEDLLDVGPRIATAAPVDRPPGSVPKDGIQGKETPDGMLRTPDGVESGMKE